jgi:cobalt-zinc-cadmium efflux system protein
MSTTDTALTAHLVMPVPPDDAFLNGIADVLRAKYGINHATIQVERGEDTACHQSDGCAE